MLQLNRQLLICFFAAVCCIYRRCWFHRHTHMVDLIWYNAACSPLFWMENKLQRERFKAIRKDSSCAAVIVFMRFHVNAQILPCMLHASYIFILFWYTITSPSTVFTSKESGILGFILMCTSWSYIFSIIFPCNPFS